MKFYEILTQYIDHDPESYPTKLRKFQCRGEPKISLRYYLQRIDKYTALELNVKVCALIYVKRLVTLLGTKIPYLCMHRIILMVFRIATKFIHDESYTNDYFSRVGGVSLKEFNDLELYFLTLIDFNLYIDKDEYDQTLADAT